jgi:hypothetical protein
MSQQSSNLLIFFYDVISSKQKKGEKLTDMHTRLKKFNRHFPYPLLVDPLWFLTSK